VIIGGGGYSGACGDDVGGYVSGTHAFPLVAAPPHPHPPTHTHPTLRLGPSLGASGRGYGVITRWRM
jgi:hypothetical protein